MNELILNLKIIGQLLLGLLLGVLGLTVVVTLLSFFIFPEEEIITNNINQKYYYTEQTRGWATTSTVHEINIYERRENNYRDRKLANLSMYYNDERIEVEIKSAIINVWVNRELKLTHKISNGIISLNPEERWNE